MSSDSEQSPQRAEEAHSEPHAPAKPREHHARKPGHLAKDHGHSSAKKRSRWLIWAPIVVIIVLIGGCIALRKPKKKQQAPPTIPVSVAQVKKGSIDVIVNGLGIVTPVYTVSVTSRVSGAITEIDYKEGQMVKKGDQLLVIDPGPYQAAVNQAEGQLERDQATLDNARIDLSRYQGAFKEHAVPQQQVATQLSAVKGDEGTVKLDQGNLDAAKVNLAYTRIVSPIDGRVGLRGVDLGNIVAAGGTTPLLAITQLQPITVIFTVAEDELDAIVPEMNGGHPLRVDALDRTMQKTIAQGTLETLDNQINTATGTVRARATFDNKKNELFPNQFVNARLYVKTLTDVDLVPTASIQRNDTTAFVYVLQQDSTVKSQNVTITTSEGDFAAVTGVNPGDTLVTDGFEKLQNGSKVAVRQPKGAKAPTSKAGSPPPKKNPASDGS